MVEKVNGHAPIVAMGVSIVSMIISAIVGLTVLFGNPLHAASRADVKEEVQDMKVDINARIDRMESRVTKRIEEVHSEINNHVQNGKHNGGR